MASSGTDTGHLSPPVVSHHLTPARCAAASGSAIGILDREVVPASRRCRSAHRAVSRLGFAHLVPGAERGDLVEQFLQYGLVAGELLPAAAS